MYIVHIGLEKVFFLKYLLFLVVDDVTRRTRGVYSYVKALGFVVFAHGHGSLGCIHINCHGP